MHLIFRRGAQMSSQQVLIRLPEVMSVTGLRRSQVYALAQAGRFVRPIKLSERSSAWPAAEVHEWVAQRIAQRDSSSSS